MIWSVLHDFAGGKECLINVVLLCVNMHLDRVKEQYWFAALGATWQSPFCPRYASITVVRLIRSHTKVISAGQSGLQTRETYVIRH
jgi:hypothetical protein